MRQELRVQVEDVRPPEQVPRPHLPRLQVVPRGVRHRAGPAGAPRRGARGRLAGQERGAAALAGVGLRGRAGGGREARGRVRERRGRKERLFQR